MRHPTLALVLLALAATAGCDAGPEWAQDPQVISQACEPTEPYGDLIALVRDPRINAASVLSAHVCDLACVDTKGDARECPCPAQLPGCDPEEWRSRCSPAGYSVVDHTLVVGCGPGALYSGARAVVRLHH